MWKESPTYGLFSKSGLRAIRLDLYLIIIHIGPDLLLQTCMHFAAAIICSCSDQIVAALAHARRGIGNSTLGTVPLNAGRPGQFKDKMKKVHSMQRLTALVCLIKLRHADARAIGLRLEIN